ncbi:hypothetical protein F2Q69_00056540 [Brassica cretica]|uniref:Uncharacterized protein n=1 Tax=Brassica cretica TaxID=69181 RepID=A0A8S9N4D5_BRACR|nr:hypothetical protein F2Q69_00056540 [Brassica cretica]
MQVIHQKLYMDFKFQKKLLAETPIYVMFQFHTQIFSEIGGFTAAPSIETTPFGFGGTSVNQQSVADHLKFEDNTTVQQQFGDPTAQIDPNMGFEPLDWGSGGGDQTLFDLTSSVDHAYWSQSPWASSDQDQNGLYLP